MDVATTAPFITRRFGVIRCGERVKHGKRTGAIIGAFMAAGRGSKPIYLGTHMPLDEISEAAEQSGATFVLLSIARDCEPEEQRQLIAGITSLAKEHEIWLGLPEHHELSRYPLPARLIHRYEHLDSALIEQPAKPSRNSG